MARPMGKCRKGNNENNANMNKMQKTAMNGGNDILLAAVKCG